MNTATFKLAPIPPFGARLVSQDTNPAMTAFRASAQGGSLSVLDVASAIRKGTWPRTMFAVIMAFGASTVLSPLVAALWCGLMVAWEFAIRIWLEDHVLVPIAARSQQNGFAALATIHWIGAIGYMIFPAATWMSGDSLGMVLATAWVSGAANHAFVYFSSERSLLLSSVIPIVACAVVAPFLTHGFSSTAIFSVMAMLCLLLAAGVFGFDRRVLLSVLAKNFAARVAAEQANTAKSQFLATMSHELRTPLNAVIGYAELIEEETNDAQGDIAEDARKIRDSARQLLSVIDVILDLSKLETGATKLERDRFDIAAVLTNLRAAAMPLAALNANELQIETRGSLGEAEIDHVRLHQCLMQLVSNAAKFTKSGSIRVLATRSELDGRARLVFEVSDTGIGISSEQQSRIFEPFTQVESDADRSYEGAGLGLTLVQRLAHLMGGDVTCTSELGKGSTFILAIDAGPA